jgi:RNA polymerase sigma factor (sigma-70 family)
VTRDGRSAASQLFSRRRDWPSLSGLLQEDFTVMATLTYGTAAPVSTRPHSRDAVRSTGVRSDGEDSAVLDAALVVCFRQTGGRDVLRELFARHYVWLRRVIGRRARRAGLCREDAEDSHQEAVFALYEAITDYDPRESARPCGCSFRTYLGRRVASRFASANYRRRWEKAHRCGELELRAALEGGMRRLSPDGTSRDWRDLEDDDPAVVVQCRQLDELVRQTLQRFPPRQQRLWEGAMAGVPLEQLAREAGLSVRTVVRQIQQVNVYLRVVLRDWAPESWGSVPPS